MSILNAVDCGTLHLTDEYVSLGSGADLTTTWTEMDVSEYVPKGTTALVVTFDFTAQGTLGGILCWTSDTSITPSTAFNRGRGLLVGVTTARLAFRVNGVQLSNRKFWVAEYDATIWRVSTYNCLLAGYYI